MQLPREVIVGSQTLNLVADICKRLGFSKSAFVITGPITYHIAGKRVIDLLDDAGIVIEYSVLESPNSESIAKVEKKVKKTRSEVILGVGGGTKIDVAKLISSRIRIPFVSIPTAASHDGIASPVTSLNGLNKSTNPQIYSKMAQSPMVIIADTDIISEAPHRFMASGCGDVIAKLTAVQDWKLASLQNKEYYGEYASSLALMSVKHIMENSNLIETDKKEGIRVLLEALMSCGVSMSIAGSSRPCSGSEHLFSHALNLIAPKPAMHGEQCGVGTILMTQLQGHDWHQIRRTLKTVGAPTSASELEIEKEHIIQALVQAQSIRTDRYTILEKKRLNHKSAERIARTTKVIE